MPNWTDSHLVILVPRANLEALKADLAGPRMWPSPMADVNGGGLGRKTDAISNHQKVEIEGQAEKFIARFRALPVNQGLPDWMPVSRMDIEAMLLADEDLGAELEAVPFSIPKLRPWEGREEFDRLFPGQMNGPYWDVADDMRQTYNHGGLGSLAVCREKLGCKWPPSDVRITDEDTMGDDDIVDLHIRFSTPWTPIRDFASIVRDTLARHGAKALLVWEEEDSCSGYDYVNPAEGREETDDFGRDLALEGEDEDGDPLSGVDREQLIDRAICGAEDDDFHGLF